MVKGTAYQSHGGPADADAVNRAVEKALFGISRSPELNGVQLNDVACTTGDNTITHSLKRIPVDYRIGKQDAAASIYWVAWDRTTITLNVSADVTLNLKVF